MGAKRCTLIYIKSWFGPQTCSVHGLLPQSPRALQSGTSFCLGGRRRAGGFTPKFFRNGTVCTTCGAPSGSIRILRRFISTAISLIKDGRRVHFRRQGVSGLGHRPVGGYFAHVAFGKLGDGRPSFHEKCRDLRLLLYMGVKEKEGVEKTQKESCVAPE